MLTVIALILCFFGVMPFWAVFLVLMLELILYKR